MAERVEHLGTNNWRLKNRRRALLDVTDDLRTLPLSMVFHGTFIRRNGISLWTTRVNTSTSSACLGSEPLNNRPAPDYGTGHTTMGTLTMVHKYAVTIPFGVDQDRLRIAM